MGGPQRMKPFYDPLMCQSYAACRNGKSRPGASFKNYNSYRFQTAPLFLLLIKCSAFWIGTMGSGTLKKEEHVFNFYHFFSLFLLTLHLHSTYEKGTSYLLSF